MEKIKKKRGKGSFRGTWKYTFTVTLLRKRAVLILTFTVDSLSVFAWKIFVKKDERLIIINIVLQSEWRTFITFSGLYFQLSVLIFLSLISSLRPFNLLPNLLKQKSIFPQSFFQQNKTDCFLKSLPRGHHRPPRCNAGGFLGCSSYQGGQRRASLSNPSGLHTHAAKNKTGLQVFWNWCTV